MATKRKSNQTAPPVPVEFTGTLAEQAEEALGNWLKATGAPPEVLELIGCLILLERYYGDVDAGNTENVERADIGHTIADTARLMVALGAVFDGGRTYSPRRKDVPDFSPPRDGKTVAQRLHESWAKDQSRIYIAD